MRMRLWILAVAASLTLAPAARGDHEPERPHLETAKLGKVRFPVTTPTEYQPLFTRGVALLHSFAYTEAAATFAKVAAKDPGCAMAYWGIAMSNFHPVWGPPTEAEFAAGRRAAEKAASLPHRSERERDYVGAIGAFYRGDDVPHPARVRAFEQGMAEVARRNPDDSEAAIFHALAMLGVAYNSPPDKSYALQKRAAEVLNRLLPLEPEHPGIAHYMIHSFDYPDLAGLALPAARAYAGIAPSAPHALHMPSHIFTRLGMWRESIESNRRSAETAQAWIAATHPEATSFDALHAMDYMEYAYLQTGQDAAALEIVNGVAKVTAFDLPTFSAGYALAAIPARHALERRDWKAAAALAPRPADFPWDRYPYAEAILHFARAVGGARSGDLKAARLAAGRLAEIKAALDGRKGFDWATQVEIQRLAAEGWLARARKRDGEALALMRSAADLEDRTDKHPVTPGSVLPAREQLADLLLELGRPAEALAEYEASMRTAPARLNSIRGAELAAEGAGQPETAKKYRDLLVAMCEGAVPPRATATAAVTR